MEHIETVKWNVFEQFSKVARFSRDTAANILEHPLARPIIPHLPPGVNNLIQSDPARSVVEEYDAGRIYLAKWAASVAEQAEEAARLEYPDQILSNNWKKRWSDTELKPWEEETEVGAFEILSGDTTLPPLHASRSDPLNAETWFSFFDDSEGRLRVELNEVREAVFRGGVEDDIRIEVWKFFLGIYPWDSSRVERESILEAKKKEYLDLKREWWDDPEVQSSSNYKEQKSRIEKDVIRTDRTISFFAVEDMPHPDPLSSASSNLTNNNLESMKAILMTYNFYNKDLGYVQGMSDLLAPVFVVMRDEVTAFWAFVGFMNRMEANFYRDQVNMRNQLLTLDHLIQFMDPRLHKHLQKTDSLNLFFCFRWILIWFKREFKWDEVLYLWEVLWSDHLSSQFHLFVALAILDKHRMIIMEYLHQFDEILKYVNDLSMSIPLDETLLRAETLFLQFQRMVTAIDKKRLGDTNETSQDSNEGVRRRKGKDPVNNDNNDGGEGTSNNTMRFPVVSDLLRGLLNKDTSQP
ncbi:rab-GTPase-TBC domain-containing protein [Glomus cerebriforme]|uniref:GTPase-activating protein GYP7 n=1 Tax=Glomus cerebriforme TaxID=658196 RepID=A0A397TCM2_9GLOM|nr:rab-GTPase-TBC domain-containing protein [Glomus cerebriforme]